MSHEDASRAVRRTFSAHSWRAVRIAAVKGGNMHGLHRATVIALLAAFAWCSASGGAAAQSERPEPQQVLHAWYGLVLELVRHTPTYSPPVAARSFAYLGATAFEAAASGS